MGPASRCRPETELFQPRPLGLPIALNDATLIRILYKVHFESYHNNATRHIEHESSNETQISRRKFEKPNIRVKVQIFKSFFYTSPREHILHKFFQNTKMLSNRKTQIVFNANTTLGQLREKKAKLQKTFFHMSTCFKWHKERKFLIRHSLTHSPAWKLKWVCLRERNRFSPVSTKTQRKLRKDKCPPYQYSADTRFLNFPFHSLSTDWTREVETDYRNREEKTATRTRHSAFFSLL